MKRFYFLVLLAIMMVGLWALTGRMTEGMSVTNLSSYFSWGLWVVLYIFFIGLSAGSFLLSTMIYVFQMHSLEKVGRLSLLSALLALVAGLMFVLIDLGHPERFWYTLVYRNMSSVLEWEIHFYLFYILLVVAELWLVMREDLSLLAESDRGLRGKIGRLLSMGYCLGRDEAERTKQEAVTERWVKVLGIIGIPLALGVHGGTGSIFAVTIAKPYWNNSIVPIIFIVSALVSGSALITFLYAFFGKEEPEKSEIVKSLGKMLILFISIDMILVLAEFFIGLYGAVPEDAEALYSVIDGPYSLYFWVGQLGLASLIPITLIALSTDRNSIKLHGLAGLSTVLGIVAVRVNLVLPAYTVPQLPGLEKAYSDPRLIFHYIPSAIELLSSMGIIAMVVLLFGLAWKLLPIAKIPHSAVRSDCKPPVHTGTAFYYQSK